jgi:hypothetical protein
MSQSDDKAACPRHGGEHVEGLAMTGKYSASCPKCVEEWIANGFHPDWLIKGKKNAEQA